MPIRDVAAQNRSLDNDYGPTRGPNAPDAFEVALFDGDPRLSGVELSGGGYARADLDNDAWSLAADGVKTVSVTFDDPTGAWTQASFWALYDPVEDEWWDCARLATSLRVTSAGDGPVVVLSVFYENI